MADFENTDTAKKPSFDVIEPAATQRNTDWETIMSDDQCPHCGGTGRIHGRIVTIRPKSEKKASRIPYDPDKMPH